MQRRPLRYADFAAVLADAESLHSRGYDRAGNWSLAQICDHLAPLIIMPLDGFPNRFPWVVRILARWFFLGRILKHRVFHPRVPAPPYLIPADTSDDTAAIERLRAALARFEAHRGPMQPSPIFGPLSPQEWREIHLWHCEHHFSFLLPRTSPSLPSS